MIIIKWLVIALLVFIPVRNVLRIGWRKYLIGVLFGLDLLLNAYGGGRQRQSVSGRCGRGYGERWYWTVLGRILNSIDPGHIERAAEFDRLLETMGSTG